MSITCSSSPSPSCIKDRLKKKYSNLYVSTMSSYLSKDEIRGKHKSNDSEIGLHD